MVVNALVDEDDSIRDGTGTWIALIIDCSQCSLALGAKNNSLASIVISIIAVTVNSDN